MLNLASHEYSEWENLTLILLENGATVEELVDEIKQKSEEIGK